MTRILMAQWRRYLLACGSASAQIGTSAPSPLGITSPLGIGPAAPVPPTGIPLGTTESRIGWREPDDLWNIAG